MREWLDALEQRTKRFAIDAVRFAAALERTTLPRSVSWQLVRSATSVGANHRASRHARSDRELISKLAVVVEEADESVFWLELVRELQPSLPDAGRLEGEAREIRAIFAKGVATLRRREKG